MNLETAWGTTGLLLEGPPASTMPTVAATISYAPSTAVHRLRELPFAPLPEASALVFCLTVAEGQPRSSGRRILQKAMAQLKARGVEEAYAVTREGAGSADPPSCRFFPTDILAAGGFEAVAGNGDLILMRADLRGLLSLVDRVETAVKRMLRNEPTPSPAAWTHRVT